MADKAAAKKQPDVVLEENVLGRAYFVMTLTYHYTGRLQKVTPTALVFDEAAWIPRGGRLNALLTTGIPQECEPIPGELVLPRHECRLTAFNHPLPRTLK